MGILLVRWGVPMKIQPIQNPAITAIGSRLFIEGERSCWWISLPIEIDGDEILCAVRMNEPFGGPCVGMERRDEARKMRDRLQHILNTGGTIWAIPDGRMPVEIRSADFGLKFPAVKGFKLHRRAA